MWQLFLALSVFPVGPFRIVFCDDPPAGSESRSVVLEHACAVSLEPIIHSGEFRYSLKTRSPVRTDASEIREYARKGFEGLLAGDPDPDTRKMIEGLLANNSTRDFQQEFNQNSNRLHSFYFALQDASIGGDRYVEFSRLDPETRAPLPGNEFDGMSSVLQRSYNALSSSTLAFNSKSRVAITGIQLYSGTQDPHRLGRMNGSLLWNISTMKDFLSGMKELLTTIEVSTVDGGTLQEVKCELKPPGAKVATRLRYHIDPDRGYLVPLIEESSEDGALRVSWHCSDYFVADDGLWFPGTCTYRQYGMLAAAVGGVPEVVREEIYEFTPAGVVLNKPVSLERFKVEIPAGTTVLDSKQKPFVAKESIALSLDDAANLSAIKGLVPPKLADKSVHVAVENPGINRTGLIVSGMIAGLFAVIVFWWRRRLFRGAGEVSALVAALLTGCGDVSTQSIAPPVQAMMVTPSPLALGELVAGRDAKLTFRIANPSASDFVVEIIPSCGCTTAETDHLLVAALSDVTNEITMATQGRDGQFDTRIVFIARDVESKTEISRSEVAVTAQFRSDWTASPRRLMLAGQEGIVSNVSVTGPSREWGEVEVLWPEQTIEHELTSSSIAGDFETRVFRVSVLGNDVPSGMLCFKRNGGKAPFFSVPVLVSASSPE